MWSFGCMVAGIVFNRLPFFRAHDNMEQLLRIAEVLGTDKLHEYIKKYQLNVDPIVLSTIGTCRRRDWSEFVASGNQNLICTELFDLLDNLLMYDHGVKCVEVVMERNVILHKSV